MLKVGGEAYFVQFLDQLRNGRSLDEALKAVYAADRTSLARSYVDSLPSGGKSPARKPKK
jgi:hypothetical protein